MNIKDFASDFLESVNNTIETTGQEYDIELAKSILEYIEDSGEINAPEICCFKKTRTRITAYDYNDEAESLDLFYLVKADTFVGKVNNNKIERGFNYLQSFYRETMNGTLLKGLDISISDEIYEVATLVKSTKGHISQLRLYVISDGLSDPSAIPSSIEAEDGIIIEYNVWDIQRIYQQHNLRAGRERIEIDFPTEYNTEIQCLKMSDENPLVDAYLAIIPGITLAKIYKRYQQALLEKNVRTFLQFKGKVNRGIRKTIREEPAMFFSYNNGISTTASEIEIKEKGRSLFISRIVNWQIVNGGQTTASIAALLNDSASDLSQVYVPMKVSVIRCSEEEATLVKRISTYANSQTAIKTSDFSANEDYLAKLEMLSRQENVTDTHGRIISGWYFERTRGQYADQLSTLNGFDEKCFKRQYPKSHKITKTDLAKYEMAWNQRPFEACWGAEKCFASFITQISQEMPNVTPLYFKNMVAKCILFTEIDRRVKNRNLGGHKAKMNAYILASLSFLSDGRLDLKYIWDHQKVQEEIGQCIELLIEPIWNILTNGLKTSDTWARRSECWIQTKILLNKDFEKLDGNVLQKDSEEQEFLNETQQIRIKEAEEYEPGFWFELAQWAKSNDMLTPLERKEVFNYGTMRSRNRTFKSLKQALNALNIIKKAREYGFNK